MFVCQSPASWPFAFQCYWARFAVVLSQAPACGEYKADVKHLIRMLTLGTHSCLALKLCRRLWKISVSGRSCCVQPMAYFDLNKSYVLELILIYVKLDWGRSCIVLCVQKSCWCLWTQPGLIAVMISISLFSLLLKLVGSLLPQLFQYRQTWVTASVWRGENSRQNSVGTNHLSPSAILENLLFPFVTSKSLALNACPLMWYHLRLALCITENNSGNN